MLLNRRALLAAVVGMSVTTLPVLAQSGDDAIAFVKSVYRLNALWRDVAANPSQYLTPEFVAAIDENDKYKNDYAVGYDPLVQTQDWGVLKNFKLTIESTNTPRAMVRASFVNLNRPTTVRFDLLKTTDGWRIADLFNPAGVSLRQEYEDLNRKARAAAAKN
jgi:hypothetical protein